MAEEHNSFSPKQKLAIAWSIFLTLVITLCSVTLILNSPKQNDVQTLQANVVYTTTIKTSAGNGIVAGASDTRTITPTTVKITQNPVVVNLGVYTSKTPISIQRKVPTNCLNTDGYFCRAAVTFVGQCHDGICGATQLTYTVTPDVNGYWTLNIPGGLDPGDYEITIKNTAGTILEVTKFTVTSKSALPNTGIEDFVPYLSIPLALIAISAGVFFLKKKQTGNVIG